MQTLLEALGTLFIFYILPYITVTIFFGGILYNIISWLRTPAPSTVLTLYPKPSEVMVGPAMALDETIFPSLFSNKILWIFGVLLHLSLLAIAFGHVRLFGEPELIWSLMNLNEQGVETFALIAGGGFGIIFMVALLVLLARRLSGIMKTVSIPMDYLLLILLIAIAISGNFMRFAMHLNVAELQVYFSSLLVFNPTLTPTVLEPAFIIHYLITQALFIYLPFSKLVHVIGSLVTNYLVKR
ncbi:MAG: respiratory nitrate reductase subunit gamma [Candidatus Hermodarchaeota archaeon]